MEIETAMPETYLETMDQQVDLSAVADLLSLAHRPDDGPAMTTRSSAMKDGLGLYHSAREKVKKIVKDIGKVIEKEEDIKVSVNTALNTVVKLLKDVIAKVNVQGGMLKEILDDMKKRPSEEICKEEFEKMQTDLHKEIQERKEEMQTEIKNKTDALEKEFKRKHDELEKNCDEGRQREMKGTLIVSSPKRGNIRTQAVHRPWLDEQGNTLGGETDLDLVLRMVQIKTGIRFPITDVVACHRIGKKDSHSFVLKIGNRQPYSCWDALTHGMMTGTNFTNDNIFINFMLTKRRTELSKQVRQARKDTKIQNYSIDQNGKFFIKKSGDDNKWHPIFSLDDLEKLSKKD